MSSRRGLGRGLDALIPGSSPAQADVADGYMASSSAPRQRDLDEGASGSNVYLIPIDAIERNEQQPRTAVEESDDLYELRDSISEYGLLQPLIVSYEGDDEQGPRYQLIAGERRWQAARMAGLDVVPAMIREATPRQMLEIALVENLQRADLNPIETAHGYSMLIEEYGLTQDQVAERVGLNRATVANTLRLLKLPQEILDALVIMPDVFTKGHANAVLMVNRDADRIGLKNLIVAQGMSVREAEDKARQFNEVSLQLAPDRRGGAPRAQSPETHILEQEFTRAVEMKARLQRTVKGKGSLTLYFTNEQQLQTLYERLVGAHFADRTGAFGVFADPGAQALLDSPYGDYVDEDADS
jgi:ParB family transcriptional regulator, chromosome partitioning protein